MGNILFAWLMLLSRFVITTKGSVDLYNPKTVRSNRGFAVPRAGYSGCGTRGFRGGCEVSGTAVLAADGHGAVDLQGAGVRRPVARVWKSAPTVKGNLIFLPTMWLVMRRRA